MYNTLKPYKLKWGQEQISLLNVFTFKNVLSVYIRNIYIVCICTISLAILVHGVSVNIVSVFIRIGAE